ncbi:hypothetical protein ACFVMC_07330 [Nocardia sp. NPDC127579]|uniref:hypothetical protein n=1 Tax=Nocardia sp. NPDC127579 TaxID=3345402 RepID=UPI0036302552
MRKIRTFGIAVATAGLLFSGAGVAAAADETPVGTGSATLLTALLTGSAEAPAGTETVADEPTTGSASPQMLELLTKLITGSAATPEE